MGNNNSSVQNFMVKAQSYKISYDYVKAIDCYDLVLKIDPKYIGALYNKGYAYNILKEY